MSHTTSSSFNFQSVFNVTLEEYEKVTKNNLRTHPIATKLQACDTPAAVLSVLHDLTKQFDQTRSNDTSLRNWLDPTVNVLYAFSATLGEGVGLVFSPARVIFAGIGVLLLAAKDVNASQDALIDLFARIENFFRRLESYTEVPPTPMMMDMITKIMVEVLHILAIATTEIRPGRRRKYLKKLLGKSDVEDALKKLDTLTREEAKMAIAEILKVTHMMDDKIRTVIDAIAQQATSKVDEEKLKQLQSDLRRWLSPPDPSTNHNMARSLHHERTASWFFESDVFKQWKSSASLLWIHGKPGSGKSILSSSVIEDIMSLHDGGTAFLAYFYCDFRDEDKRGRRSLLLSILSQLSAQSNLCCGILSRLFSTHDGGERKPSDRALRQCLNEMLSLPGQGPIYLVVDALDECPNNSGMPTAREEVLQLVEDLVGLGLRNLHICVTSRPEIDIQTTLEPLTSLRLSLHNQDGQREDITDYIRSVVYSDAKMRRWREGDKILVIETLTDKADGMFRWVYCQLETLRHCLPPGVRRALEELPETLDETYERVLRDINKANREHAHRLLQCLTVAIRPLRVEELAEVLAIDFDAAQQGGIPKWSADWRWPDQHQAVLSTCSSLIIIADADDLDSQVVQFSHFTVKEFLTSDRLAGSSEDVSGFHIVLESAHTILAQASLGVLLCLDDRIHSNNPDNIPLVEYAGEHWVVHAQFNEVSPRIRDAVEYFFDADKPHWAPRLWGQTIDGYWEWFIPSEGVDDGCPLYFAALYGFYDVAERLVGQYPEHINARCGLLVTPLVAALHGKHFKVAELLHHHGADVNVRGGEDWRPLHIAATGHVDVLQWLLDHGADVNARRAFPQGFPLWTPLHQAAYFAELPAVQALLKHGADVNARDNEGQVPLHIATSPQFPINHLDILESLLEYGSDVNARDDAGCTPLHSSAWREKLGFTTCQGTVEGARLLLEHGANIDAEDDEGRTPLQVAVAHGHHVMAAFLTEYTVASLNETNAL